jgi:hypothetical protein
MLKVALFAAMICAVVGMSAARAAEAAGADDSARELERLRQEVEDLRRHVNEPAVRKGEPAPAEPAIPPSEEIRRLKEEIARLKARLREREEIESLRRQRDELRRRLGETPGGKPETPEVPTFQTDRVGLLAGLGVMTADVGASWGWTDNLGERRHDRESESWVRPSLDLAWVHMPGLVATLGASQHLYSDRTGEDYDRVDLAAWFWGLGYSLHHVSDTSEFVTDRIQMTRHTVSLDPCMPLAILAHGDDLGAGLLAWVVPTVRADFARSGDLEYDALTVEVGSAAGGTRAAAVRGAGQDDDDRELGSTASASVGFTRRWYDTKGFKDELALIGRLNYSYTAPRWDLVLTAASRLEDDLFDFAGHKRVSDLDVRFTYVLRSWVRLVAGSAAGVEDFDVGDDAYGEDRRDVFLRGRLGAQVKVFPHGILEASYLPELRESNISDFDAVISRVELGLKLTF